MANKIQVKRSAVPAKVPTTGDLDLGEIAINTYDGKMYIKKDDGTATIVQIGAGGAGTGDVVGPSSATDNAITRFDGTTGKLIQNSTVTMNDDGTIANLNAITFDTTPTNAPTATGSMFWDTGDGTPSVILNANTSLQLGQENIALVYNGTGSTITNGSVVAVAGAQGQRPSVVLADADSEPYSAATLGIATENIANGAEGFICTFGLVRGLNTSAFTAGDPIWLSQTAGQFTATRPDAPAHSVFLGWVIKVNASSGEVFVHISNGWELNELHNVLITSPQSGNTLIYDASASVWKNANLTDGTGITITEGAGSITIANAGITSAAAGTGISVSASTGAVTITNTAPDQTVALTGGTGISTSGTYPNFTITNTAPDQTVSLTGAGATSISGTYPNFTISSTNTTYSAATSTVLGLIELNSDTVQSTAANAVTSTASRTYGLQVNSAGQGVINVPWTDSGGTVTSVATGTGLTGGPITTTGTISLANTAVTAGSYTNANITVDAQGRITSASNGSGGGSTTYQAVGTYMFAGFASGSTTGLAAGSTIGGGSIAPAGLGGFSSSATNGGINDGTFYFAGNSSTANCKKGATMSGTWQSMGASANPVASSYCMHTLYIRIA